MLIITIFVFPHFLSRWIDDHPQEEGTKFGKKVDSKL